MLTFHGAWRITVLTRDADFEQRAVVRGPHGTRVVPGRPGATLEVDEDTWTLALEHLAWGRTWEPNQRTTTGPLTDHAGLRSRLLTSSDRHFPGKPLDYPNLVLRLDQPTTALRALRPVGAPMTPAAPTAPRAIRTTSSAASYGRPTETRPAASDG
ncbi:hypothetical protein PUR71_02270 [Streptomyces sp. SP17BM10]|uniref:hypothetical protein n=1 Tax=Streptomyces sp. SP17BM10 TaxID=3002530 RepID=UPI002E799ED9|nr:hypothetical protein [Streptomyces sp. SP17BM10]MEE1781762.1 hypothetical protein [Streptomyces sp. SP17BM10]